MVCGQVGSSLITGSSRTSPRSRAHLAEAFSAYGQSAEVANGSRMRMPLCLLRQTVDEIAGGTLANALSARPSGGARLHTLTDEAYREHVPASGSFRREECDPLGRIALQSAATRYSGCFRDAFGTPTRKRLGRAPPTSPGSRTFRASANSGISTPGSGAVRRFWGVHGRDRLIGGVLSAPGIALTDP
jgi:hypothetical protein